MPYPAGHKEKTKIQILNSAGVAFRLNGIHATSLPQIMKGAGLTHGGFYNYFSSKEQLVSEVCSKIVDDTLAFLSTVAENSKNESKIDAVINFYLSSTHREDIQGGCIFPILTGEISRSNEYIRQVYSKELERFIEFMSNLADKGTEVGSTLVSIMVGSLMLSRSTDSFIVSNRILSAGNKHAKELLLS